MSAADDSRENVTDLMAALEKSLARAKAHTGQCRAMLDANRCIKDADHDGQHTNGLLLWGGTLRDRLGRAVTADEAAHGSDYL